MREEKETYNVRRTRLILTLVPLFLFLALSAVFFFRLGIDASQVPSALIGKPVPKFSLPALAGSNLPGLSSADLRKGNVTLVNIFASWCGPCRDEHPQLMWLANNESLRAKGLRLAGLNYKDKPANANRFLKALGNPYSAIGVDANGRVAIDWGGYGVPETFIVKGDGTITYKFIGPISKQALQQKVLPQIEKAMQ